MQKLLKQAVDQSDVEIQKLLQAPDDETDVEMKQAKIEKFQSSKAKLQNIPISLGVMTDSKAALKQAAYVKEMSMHQSNVRFSAMATEKKQAEEMNSDQLDSEPTGNLRISLGSL